MGNLKATARISAILFLAAGLVAAQEPQQPQPPASTQPARGEQNRAAATAKASEPAIKNKDIWEGTGYWHPFGRMPRFVLHDQKVMWTSPFHMNKHDAKYWAIFGAATGVLIGFDEQIQQKAPNPTWLVNLGTTGSYFGAAYTLIPVTAGFYFIGSKTSNERFREAGLMGFEALIDSTIIEETLKVVTDRERPLEGTGEGRFFHSPNRINAGFPSGHSINTFALASVFAHEYHDKLWVKLMAYSWAGIVAGSRLAANRHFPSDTLAGGAMGWFIGDYVYNHRHNPATDTKRSITQKILDHVQLNFAGF